MSSTPLALMTKEKSESGIYILVEKRRWIINSEHNIYSKEAPLRASALSESLPVKNAIPILFDELSVRYAINGVGTSLR